MDFPRRSAVPVRFPDGYGDPSGTLNQWEEVAAVIAGSPNYLLATVTDDGRPHLRPVDGVFVADTFCFGGSPQATWVRHLERRPAVTVSLPDPERAGALRPQRVFAWSLAGFPAGATRFDLEWS